MNKKKDEFQIILPQSGRGLKEIKLLLNRRKGQANKAIEKLKKDPTDFAKKGIEKLDNPASRTIYNTSFKRR